MNTKSIEITPHLRRFLLRSADLSIIDIARQLPSPSSHSGHLSHTTVAAVLDGRARSRRVELCIADATGLPLHQLWPAWYGPDDERIKKRKKYGSVAAAATRIEANNHTERMVA